jgi:hypothetical protein
MDDKTPIEFVPVSLWRVALQNIAKLALYIIIISVIIGPTLLMIITKSGPNEPCVRPLSYKKAT